MLDCSYEYDAPHASSLVQSLRAFGYDIKTAAADLIDNSLTAGAERIWIVFEWNDGRPWIAIEDDGSGMSEQELVEAMRPGSRNPEDERESSDLGRFGLGLKTASFSQCRKFTVGSRREDGSLNERCWDLDVISKMNDWILLKKGSETSSQVIQEFFCQVDHGTAVVWENLDRIIPEEHIEDEDYQQAFIRYAEEVKFHVAAVFSDFMLGFPGRRRVRIFINGNQIEPWDPFMTGQHPGGEQQPKEDFFINGHEVTVCPYILPHRSKLSADDYEKYAGEKGWTAQQGFYLFRNHRMIVSGNWLLPGMQKKEQYKLARIRIDIDNGQDKEWSIDVKKSMAVPPVSKQEELRRIAIATQRLSAQVFRHRGKKITRTSRQDKTYFWHQRIRDGKIGYEINRNHPFVKKLLNSEMKPEIQQLLRMLEETIPVPAIISDYSENADQMLTPFEGTAIADLQKAMEAVYETVTAGGMSQEEAIAYIASTEPFMYKPDMVELFKEEKENSHEQSV